MAAVQQHPIGLGARIVSIDTTAALQHPRVHAVITGKDLEARKLAWMPTMSDDTQAVLATDKVRFQGQEVAFVVADDRYCARDALELIAVEYEPLAVVVDARKALDDDAPVIRDGPDGQRDNHTFDWEAGDEAATDDVFARADVVVEQDMRFPRSHPAPMETCGAVASFDAVAGKLTLWCTTQAPHAHRTVYALLTGMPEHKIRVISPDIGGGFGNKVPVYPGYLCAVVGSIVTGKPVKWMEDRSENLMSTGFARDYVMTGAIAASAEGQIRAVRYLVERMVDCLPDELGIDPAELRAANLLAPEQLPYRCKTGSVYDSGDYEAALRKAMDLVGYEELRRAQGPRSRPDRRLGDTRGRARRFRLGKGPARPLVHQGRPEQGATIQEIAMAARGSVELPPGVEAGLDAETVYDPGTAKVTIRRFVAVDDCGVRITPSIRKATASTAR
jgi:CO/xanthine dehydrogenase Mo-binding subunit